MIRKKCMYISAYELKQFSLFRQTTHPFMIELAVFLLFGWVTCLNFLWLIMLSKFSKTYQINVLEFNYVTELIRNNNFFSSRHPTVFSQPGRKSFGKNSGRFISAFIFEIECSAGVYSALEQRTEWRTWTWSDLKSDRVRGIGFNFSTKIYGFNS